MRRTLCAAAVACLPLAFVPAAGATTLHTTSMDDEGPRGWVTLNVRSESGAANRVTVRIEVEEFTADFLVRDRAERLRAGRGARGRCDRLDRHTLRCTETDALLLRLGGGADRARVTEVKRGPGESFHGPTEVEIEGGPGDDDLRIGHGGRIDGGPGDDVVSVGSTPIARGSYLYGGPGRDRLRGSRGGDVLAGGEGDDRLRGGARRDELYGGNYIEPMKGPAGRDSLYGGTGDDFFDDGDGRPPRRVDSDRMHGGRGDDEVSYRARRARVVVRLWEPGGDGQRGEGDRITWMENVRGGDGNDELVGDRDVNGLNGGTGRDRVAGLAGDDVLELGEGDRADGNSGDDRLIAFEPPGQFSCGTGTDRVVWAVPAENSGEGAMIPASCEWLSPGAFAGVPASVVINPVPDFDAEGDLAFGLLSFVCCEQRLFVTEPVSPYEELGSTRLDSDRVVVPVPPEVEQRARAQPGVGVVLRAYVLAEDGRQRLVWRFQAQAPG